MGKAKTAMETPVTWKVRNPRVRIRSRGFLISLAVSTFTALSTAGVVALLRSASSDPPFTPLAVVGVVGVSAVVATAFYRLLVHPEVLRRTVEERTEELQRALIEAYLQKRELAAAQARVHGVLSSSPDAVVAGKGDGTITEWNEAAERLFGWSRGEIVGKPVSMLVPPGHAALFPNLATGETDDVRTAVVTRLRKDGTSFDAELRITMAGGAEDPGATWVAVVRDVTRERIVTDARNALGSSLEPFAAARALGEVLAPLAPFDALALVEIEGDRGRRVVCIDAEGSIVAPEGHLALAETVVGRAVDTREPAIASGPGTDRALGPARLGWILALPLCRGDDVIGALCLGGGSPAPSPSGVGLLAEIAQEIVREAGNVFLYERQREATQRLADLEQLKVDFLSAVSHELRTPLTAIAGFAATLDERWGLLDRGMRRDFVRRIVDRAEALDDLIQQLLDVGDLEGGGACVELRPCDLSVEVRREVTNLGETLAGRDVRVDVPDGTWAMADPRALQRVLRNLLENAAKFSPRHTRITVSATDRNGDVVVCVADEGSGIPPDEQERVFGRFYRVGRGDRVRAGGVGIGLTVAKEFAEAQGGRMWIESEPGCGTTVCFTLSRADPETGPVRRLQTRVSRPAQ